jgi:hypothetical protein
MPIAPYFDSMRNTLVFLAALVLSSSAWALNPGMSGDPVIGPGKAGAEKDEKGRVKGAGAGAGPHREFHQLLERRVDREEPPAREEKKEEKPEAKQEGKSGSEPEFSKR